MKKQRKQYAPEEKVAILRRHALLWFLVAATGCTQAPQPAQLAREPEIRGILEDRIDKYHQSVGIVVGLIDPQGRRVIAHGRLDQADGRPLDGDTVFEIASITKLFTSLALAEMVQRGDVMLTDPVAKYLAGIKVPERGGHQITLEDLATHTSGLPREPHNLKPRSGMIPGPAILSRTCPSFFLRINSAVIQEAVSSIPILEPRC